jgi:perosamine synthetase
VDEQMSRILYTKPSITEREINYATDAAANGWGPRCYDYLHRFEEAFARHIGTEFAIATSSCTGALHLGMAAMGIGPGDEVILADANWIASCAPIAHLGATPVFVDILRDTWCLDPGQVATAITPRTKAILAVHLYGNLADLGQLAEISQRAGVALLEDAAEAIGSQWRGRRAGSVGLFGAFSFHGTKTVTTGEGGMLVTSNAALYEAALTLSNHGRARGQTKQFWADQLGFKYKMSNIQAAIGLAQVERVGDLIERKRSILSYYRDRLRPCNEIALNPEPSGTINGAWMPTVVFDRESGVTREQLCEAFSQADIDARVFFHPLTSLPMFARHKRHPIAADIPTRAINLPSYHDMTTADQDRVIEVLLRLRHP